MACPAIPKSASKRGLCASRVKSLANYYIIPINSNAANRLFMIINSLCKDTLQICEYSSPDASTALSSTPSTYLSPLS